MCFVTFTVLLVHQWCGEVVEGREVCIEFGGEIIPGLLFADDTCLVASDERSLKKVWKCC